MDVDTNLTCAALQNATLQITSPTTAWTIPTPPDPQIRAMILAEIYRHTIDGRQVWKLKAVGQGWADGLVGLARDHGVDVA
jgi:stress response protein SCP2